MSANGPGGFVHEFCVDEDNDRPVTPPGYTAQVNETCFRCGELIEIGDGTTKVVEKTRLDLTRTTWPKLTDHQPRQPTPEQQAARDALLASVPDFTPGQKVRINKRARSLG